MTNLLNGDKMALKIKGKSISPLAKSRKPTMRIGEIIKREREKEGKSRREVTSRIGITEAYLCAIEKGKRRPPIPENGDGSLDIKGSIYYRILRDGLSKSEDGALKLILDWKLSQLGISDALFKQLILELINGELPQEHKKAILATYLGLKAQDGNPPQGDPLRLTPPTLP